jgi:hypothetical protein
MPEKEVIERARRDAQEGKAPSTQAGEFVREEFEHVREGKRRALPSASDCDWFIEGPPRRSQTAAAEAGPDLRQDASPSRPRFERRPQ